MLKPLYFILFSMQNTEREKRFNFVTSFS